MPAIDFPASPSLNDEYTFEGRTWLWNGTGWEVKAFVAPVGATGATGVIGVSGATGAIGVTGATGPAGPTALAAGSATGPSLYFTGDDNTGLYSPGADQVAISTGGTERARIDSSGRLLVGTSSAATNVFYTTVARTPKAQYETLTTEGVSILGTDGGAGLCLINGATSTLVDRNYGQLSFFGYDGTNYRNGASIAAFSDATTGTADMPGRLVFSTTADGASSPTERMRISSNGEVVMASTLSRTFSGNTVAQYAYDAGTGLPAAGQIVISCKGNDGAGGSNGVGLTRAATSWSAYSDERAKADLVPIDDGLSKVSTLRSVTGRYLDDEPGTSRSFLIAQDVQAVLPEAVDAGDPDKLSLRYTEVIPLLVAALKEAKERIETLEARITTLEAQP